MGEYAIRNSDGAEVKIGTCEVMYYLRFEDREKVSLLRGNVDINARPEGHFFRIPFLDEDSIAVGEYKDYNRGLRMYKYGKCDFCDGSGKLHGEDCHKCNGNGRAQYHDDFAPADTVDSPGIIQLTHTSGLLVNVPCFHGVKLPEPGPGMQTFWNGKSWSFELAHVKAVKTENGLELFPVVHCRHCRTMWRYQWADVIEYIPLDMRMRLDERYGITKPVAAALVER